MKKIISCIYRHLNKNNNFHILKKNDRKQVVSERKIYNFSTLALNFIATIETIVIPAQM